MYPLPFLTAGKPHADADRLLAAHGRAAAAEAAARADRSRDLGNLVRFCHWREVGRLITVLAGSEITGALH